LMVVTIIGIAAYWLTERKVPLMPLITALIVMVFGGLTVWLNDERFIKMKPTIIYVMFCVILAGGLMLNKPVLRKALGHALSLDEAGWKILTLRLAVFFACMAVANEAVWRSLTTDQWVLWKMPGSLILTLLFMAAQGPLIMRHQIEEHKNDA
jgi:intracellular septation protein